MKSKIFPLQIAQKSASLLVVAWLLLAALLVPDIGTQVVNADAGGEPMSSSTTQAAPTSPFGPHRTSPDDGIPRHAYSPFDKTDEPLPQDEIIPGQVLIKFKPVVMQPALPEQQALPTSETAGDLSSKYGITELEPVIRSTRQLTPGGPLPLGIVSEPDLTRWFRAKLSEGTQVLEVVQALGEDPSVEIAEPDYLRRPAELPSDTTDPRYSEQWQLATINASAAWQFLADNGTNPGGRRDIVTAVIDTGVDYNHPDLAGNIWVNTSEIPGNGIDDDTNGYVDDVYGANVVTNSGNPDDDHGHGTHVAGIIAAQGNNGIGGVGVAYNTQIMPIKAAQYSGMLATSDIAEAIYYAVDKGADIINMSFGGYARSQIEEDALAIAFGQAVLVAAAGNDRIPNEKPYPGYIERVAPMYPAALNWVLGVMAQSPSPATNGDNLASFSNYDGIPQSYVEYEVMAPGVDILSTLPGEKFAAWDGTSMATPVVSGIAALVRSYFWDKDMYSSRFIMGQIASTGAVLQGKTLPNGSKRYYRTADAYAALTQFPQPKLSYLEHWLFDNDTTLNPLNDGDGIVDAGETVDLAIVIRNHWGKADNVTVNLRAWAEGAFQDDPFVTMVTNNISYGAIGSFNWDDNGFIYDAEGAITGVRNPFRFSVSANTTNDHVIPFLLTMTGVNGFKPTESYTFQGRFNLMVQRGRELPRIITGADVFGPKTDYASEYQPRSVATADFNGDNFTDLAVVNGSDNGSVSVLLNNGDGSFAARTSYPIGYYPYSVVTADFNGDSRPDIAATTWNYVSVLLNNGDGSFAAKTDYYAGYGSYWVAAADFNSDNRTDLAVAHYYSDGSISILLNNGDGSFAAMTSYSAGPWLTSIVTADFNGDSRPDIAATRQSVPLGVSLRLNNGDGSFGERIDYNTGYNPSSLAAADLNGDPYADLAITSGASAYVLIGNGDGSFVPSGSYAVGSWGYSVTATDFNGDANIDLATADAGGNTVTVLMNKGDGSFLPKGRYAAGVFPFSITAADFNGDGRPDVATANVNDDTVSLLLNTGQVSLEPDLVLTKDYYWLVPDQTLIEDNAIVVVAPGAQLQFWAGDPNDPYSQHPNAYIQVEGSLLVQGSPDEPVELFPGALYWNKVVRIQSQGIGVVVLQYARVTNPFIGKDNYYWTTGGQAKLIDHSYFNQDGYEIYYWNTQLNRWEWTPPVVRSQLISNSIFHKLGPAPQWGSTYWWHGFGVYDAIQGNLYDSSRLYLAYVREASGNVFLKNYRLAYDWSGGKIYHLSRAEAAGYVRSGGDDAAGRASNQFRDNAILNRWWDPVIDHWMQFYSWQQDDTSYSRDLTYYLNDNYWGTTSTTLIDAAIQDFNDNFNKAEIIYQPILTTPPETAYPFAASVVISQGSENTTRVGPGEITFTVTFNRDMDTSVQPKVSFGPDLPVTDYTVHPIEGGWQNPRTWAGTFSITPVTGDGYQLLRIAGARAADDPWLVTGDDSERFRFEIITSGTEAMNLQATGGEGYVDLMWTQDDFDLLAGFNLYRSNSPDGTFSRLNETIIPPEQKSYRDTNVLPGQPYYYKFTVVKTDMTESDFSNVATATPLDTIPPVISHTAVSSAAVGLSLQIYADVTDNVRVASVKLYHRAIGETAYRTRDMVKTTGDRYSATLEGSVVVAPGLEYYLEASDGVSTVRSGRPDYPYQVAVGDQPVVTAVSPSYGPASGGTLVTITGSNFKSGASVTFGDVIADNVTVLSSSQITSITSPHFPRVVDVTVTNSDNQSGTLLRGFTYVSEVALLSLPDTGGEPHAIVQVPINAANVQGLVAASLTVTFDSNVLTAQGASTGTLTPDWSLAANTGIPGEVRLSMASPGSSVTGSGVLAYLEFDVVDSSGNTTALSFASVLLNDGAIPVETTNGSFQVNPGYDITGTVRFWANNIGVPGVLLTLEGARVYTGSSQADGSYTVTGAPQDNYTLTPSKSDNVSGISAYDASLVLQHDVGLITLSGAAAIAADVNKSGAITSMDAYDILQKAVDLITLPFPGAGVVWDFNPPSRSYSPLTSDQTNQDFTAILIGDVSGNWGGGVQGSSIQSISSAELSLDEVESLPGKQITIPLKLTLEQASLYGADIILGYNSAVMSAVSVNKTELATNFIIASNLNQPGEVRIATAGAVPITSSGVLLTITFDVIGEVGITSPLDVVSAALNESAIPVVLRDGSLTIVRAGDANSDSAVNALDITKVERIIAGLDASAAGADANQDNNTNAMDITKVERLIAGLD